MQLNDIYDRLTIFNFISIFYRGGNSFLSKKYEKYGLGYGQHQFLIILYGENNLTQDEIRKRLAVDKATVTREIAKLKMLGFVTVCQDAHDKRAKRVKLTEKAMVLKEEIVGISTNWENLLLENLNEEDKKNLLMLCLKIVKKPQ